MSEVISSRGESDGFFAYIDGKVQDRQAVWAAALAAVQAQTHFGQQAVRAFLDSDSGRHFAEVAFTDADGTYAQAPVSTEAATSAIARVVAQWPAMNYRWLDAKRVGAIIGAPYLNSMVAAEAIAVKAPLFDWRTLIYSRGSNLTESGAESQANLPRSRPPHTPISSF